MTSSKRKLTPKQRVLKKWPDAWCGHVVEGYVIGNDFETIGYRRIGHGVNERAAWADAARNLK